MLGFHLIVIIKMYGISVNINCDKELRYESSMDETSISLLFYSKPCVVQGLMRWQSINPKIKGLKPSGINYLQCFKWMRCSLYHNMQFSWISHIEHDQCISWWWLGFMHPKCMGTQLQVGTIKNWLIRGQSSFCGSSSSTGDMHFSGRHNFWV
mgnify:CR=1 FL=1